MAKRLVLIAALLLAPLLSPIASAQYGQTGQMNPDADFSGSITTGGAAQAIVAKSLSRTHLFFQNISDTDMTIRWTGTATAGAGSVLIKAGGGAYENSPGMCPTGAVSVYCATTGKAFTALAN